MTMKLCCLLYREIKKEKKITQKTNQQPRKNQTKQNLHNYIIIHKTFDCANCVVYLQRKQLIFPLLTSIFSLPRRLKWCNSSGKLGVTALCCKHGCPNYPCFEGNFLPSDCLLKEGCKTLSILAAQHLLCCWLLHIPEPSPEKKS